ncbi:hypothetical protein ACOMHN_021311 [Nucella lapillus]
MKGAITMKGWTGFWALLFITVCPCIAETSSSDCTPPVIRFPNRNIELDVSDTSATVPFEIIGDDCFQKIEIYEEGKTDPKDCRIRQIETAPSYGNKCNCTTTDKNYSCSITGVFSRQSKNNTLTVKVRTKQSETITTYVHFNVTFLTILKDFYVIHHKNKSVVTVEKTHNLRLQFYCSWTIGNQKPTIELHGPKNLTVIKTANNETRHTLYNMSCDDSGEYRCQVKGTDHFKSLTVLIKCPLGFKQPSSIPQQSVQTGADAKWSFNATSYTKELESCQLRKSDGTSGFACNNSRSVVNVLGSAPHLLLTVTLYNVTKADDGAWNLTASNPTKPGPAPVSNHVQFFLNVTERMFDNVLYESSDHWKMIDNTTYESSEVAPVAMTESGSLYEVVADGARKGTPSRPPVSNDEGQMYVCQEEIQRNKARNKAKAKKDDSHTDEGQMYVCQEEIQRNKARNKAKAKKDDSHTDGDVYVDQEQIRKNKALNQQKKQKNNG